MKEKIFMNFGTSTANNSTIYLIEKVNSPKNHMYLCKDQPRTFLQEIKERESILLTLTLRKVQFCLDFNHNKQIFNNHLKIRSIFP